MVDIDDDIRKKHDLRSTAGKIAAEKEQAESDEHLKIFREWAIANNRDPEEMTMEALGEFEKDQLEKKEAISRLLRKSFMCLIFFVATHIPSVEALKIVGFDADMSGGLAFVVSIPLTIWLVSIAYRTLNMGSWFILKVVLLFFIVGAFGAFVLSPLGLWMEQTPTETNQTKPTSVPSEAVTKKDSSVGLGTDSAGHYEHPDAFAGAVTEKDSSVGVSPDDTFKEDQDLKAIEADECAEWDLYSRTWLVMNCTRTLALPLSDDFKLSCFAPIQLKGLNKV